MANQIKLGTYHNENNEEIIIKLKPFGYSVTTFFKKKSNNVFLAGKKVNSYKENIYTDSSKLQSYINNKGFVFEGITK